MLRKIFEVDDQTGFAVAVGDFDFGFWKLRVDVVEKSLQLVFRNKGEDATILGVDVVAGELLAFWHVLTGDNCDTHRSQSRV